MLAGVIHDRAYFDEKVAPFLGRDGVSYVGSVGPADRDRLLGGAIALLHLIDFEEPFGLSVVEALATGTPVVATRRGSMPELVDDGLTGFLVEDVDAAERAVRRLSDVDRAACRAAAVSRFGADRMVDEYEALFTHIIR